MRPSSNLGAVTHDLPVIRRLAVDRHIGRAEQFDRPRAGRLAQQREVMARDRRFLRRKLHVAIELPPDDGPLLI